MSCAGVISCRALQKVKDMKVGLVFHVALEMIKTTIYTTLAGTFSNGVLSLTLI
jgi:hypothetical protein